ncbi:MAG: UDP-N-acetylmuramoyl-L-alanine--D-glutamate ligase [bacterium]|nr:UDP-N-acetylmuramoyl-L-alanine--D-glutamate ligase [bacterium]
MISFKNKNVLVAGLGLHGGGVGTVKFLAREGAKITVTDLRSLEVLQPSLKKLAKIKGIKYFFGEHKLDEFLKADFILKGPGVKPDSEFIIQAKKRNIPVLNDIAIFLNSCPAKIIGITGSRGKSTTAFLIWRFLQEKFKKIWLAGNIRRSVLELLPKIKSNDWVVLELSSFQLQDLADSGLEIKGKPEISVITNIYKEHLNWHKDPDDYLKAKGYITAFQNKENYLFLNPLDEKLKNIAKISRAKIIYPELQKNLQTVVDHNLGSHYRSSVALAAGVAGLLGVSKELIEKDLRSFHGLPGRQEKIRELDSISFINDTTSTMPDSTVACVERFWKLKEKDNKIILIAGGQDKNLDYDSLAKIVADKIEVLVLLPGTATEKLEKELGIRDYESRYKKIQDSKLKILYSKSMAGAVKKAYVEAKAGDYVLLSPGAASFGLFLNEFDRGKKFTEAVKKLK